MKNEKSTGILKKQLENYNKSGNIYINLPCGFNQLKTYSQYDLFPLDIFIDSVQINVINKQLTEFNVFYQDNNYIKQKIVYKKTQPSKILITVKDDKNKERYYTTDFIYSDSTVKTAH